MIHDKYECKILLKSDRGVEVSPERIRDELVEIGHFVTENKYSDRASWPNEKLKGVDIERDRLEASIQPENVGMSVEGFDEVETAYRYLRGMCRSNNLSFPSRVDFAVESVRVFSEEGDFQFVGERDESTMGVEFEAFGEVGWYDVLMGQVYIAFDEGVDKSVCKRYVTAFIEDCDDVVFNE